MPKRKPFRRTSAHTGSHGSDERADRQPRPSGQTAAHAGGYWLYGLHPIAAALRNPHRRLHRLLLTAEAAAALQSRLGASVGSSIPAIETVDRDLLDRVLPSGAVHQGAAARAEPLPAIYLEDLLDELSERPGTLVVLDQVTDPHNVGAILRSAVAFGAAGVILTERNAAPESGALAKAASGALDHLPLVRVGNLARAMDQLKAAGFWCVGLAAEARETLAEAKLGGRVALVLGAEGGGLRRLTRERCDLLVRLPTAGPIDHLNVSNAAAVALYELARGEAGGELRSPDVPG